MTVSLRDLKAAKRALRDPCRMHPTHPAAVCPECHHYAVAQQERQWRKERERAHADYLEELRRASL